MMTQHSKLKEKKSQKSAIVLLSGGLDSTVCLWWAKAQNYARVDCLTFEYGSKEEAVLVAVTKQLGELATVTTHEFITLDFLAKFSQKIGSSLSKESPKSVPQLSESDLDDLSVSKESARSVWIPARNLVFLSIASSYSEVLGEKVDIITGFNLEEGTTFPDNTQEFIDDFTAAASRGVMNAEVSIVSPLVGMSKSAIVRLGVELDIPLQYSNSCYEPKGLDNANRPIHCGLCESCLRRKRGFQEAINQDPTIYSSDKTL